MISWKYWLLLLFVFLFGYAYSLVASEQIFYDMRFLDGVTYRNVYSEQLYFSEREKTLDLFEWLMPLKFECLQDFYLLETLLEEDKMNSSQKLLFSEELMIHLPHKLRSEVWVHYVNLLEKNI